MLRRDDLFLKSLDITGFKSFARCTRFEFTPGITALVGPNGSGKSNVVDAIRWCLGEQSVRDLRGHRAEDVIYAGSRHVLGAAEVALTFAATNGEPSSPAEVTIARRLYRSGDSEYLVDGRKARLRDLLDRLRALGIDGSRHIVVTQGMADALLSATPIERRSLLEQAAGLSGYRVRRDEARQKLGTTEQNIATIALVLEELEPRLRSLRRQARAVEDRAEAQNVLHWRLHDWYWERWKAAGVELADLQARTKLISDQRTVAESRLTELEHASEAVLQREREWQQRVDILVAANREQERDRDAADRVRSEIEQKLISAQSLRETLRGRLQRSGMAVVEAEGRITEAEESIREAETEAAGSRVNEEALALKIEQERQVLGKADAEFRRAAAEAETHAHARSAALERGERLRRELDRASRRQTDVEQWLASTHGTLEEGNRESTVLAVEAGNARMRVESSTELLDAGEHDVAEWRSRGGRLDALLARMKAAASTVRRQRDSAERLLRTYADNEAGSVLRAISVRPGWETAIATALGTWAYAPIDGGPSCAMHANEIPQFDAWRKSLEREIGDGAWADEVVEGLPSGLTSPLRTTVLVASETAAAAVWNGLRGLAAHTIGTPPLQVVSRDGACWDAVGHHVSSGDDRAASYLQLKREAMSLASRYHTITERMSRVETVRENALKQRRQAEGVLETVRVKLRAGRKQLTELEIRLAGLNHQRADLEARTLALRTELGKLAGTHALLTTEFGRWEAAQGELEIAARNHDRRVQDANSLLSAARAAVSNLEHERHEIRQMYETAQAALRARTQLLTAIRSERVRIGTELTTGATEEADLELATCRYQDELASARLQVERLDRLLQEHSERLSSTRGTRPERDVSGEQVREARRIVSGLVREDERARAESLHVLERIEAIRHEIAEELRLSPNQLRPSDADPPSEAEIKRLRSRAMQYADADPSVVTEAAELAERNAYLLKHVEDLRGAAEALRTMMEVADTEMRAQFDVAFASVNEEFSRVFEVMLRGGRATLDQLDGGGIEVIAQLPGKRSRSSAAFSGGERSLIASSLLFGVLKMRPAPFCVLDEVDAALDEGNVDRYLAALRDISSSTQAIVVTHNRATMAAADALYGLTMDPEGTSRALSLRLETQAAG